MKKNKLNIIIVLSVLLIHVSPALSLGGVDGGGGIGVRCGTKLELLDIYEAKEQGLRIINNPKDLNEALGLVSKLTVNHYWNPEKISKSKIARLYKKYIFHPIFTGNTLALDDENFKLQVIFGGALQLSTDIGKINLRKGCSLEQVAFFSDKDRILKIDNKKWQELDWINKSALVLHELMYFSYRRHSIENIIIKETITSKQSREFVGKLLSKKGLTPKFHGIPLNDYTNCASDGEGKIHDFYAYNDTKNNLIVVFNLLYGLSSDYQLISKFNGLEVSNFWDQSIINQRTRIHFTDSPYSPKIMIELKKDKNKNAKMRVLDSSGSAIGPFKEIVCQ